uniref:Uncharacterized protein n=1 Tax=Hyaloperonospora arabidopsidis (strain Emoy2) TaxID=559515 RepID=M4C2I5_HYAAE
MQGRLQPLFRSGGAITRPYLSRETCAEQERTIRLTCNGQTYDIGVNSKKFHGQLMSEDEST